MGGFLMSDNYSGGEIKAKQPLPYGGDLAQLPEWLEYHTGGLTTAQEVGSFVTAALLHVEDVAFRYRASDHHAQLTSPEAASGI